MYNYYIGFGLLGLSFYEIYSYFQHRQEIFDVHKSNREYYESQIKELEMQKCIINDFLSKMTKDEFNEIYNRQPRYYERQIFFMGNIDVSFDKLTDAEITLSNKMSNYVHFDKRLILPS